MHHINWRGFDDEQFEVLGQCMECTRVVNADDLHLITIDDPISSEFGGTITLPICTECCQIAEEEAPGPDYSNWA